MLGSKSNRNDRRHAFTGSSGRVWDRDSIQEDFGIMTRGENN